MTDDRPERPFSRPWEAAELPAVPPDDDDELEAEEASDGEPGPDEAEDEADDSDENRADEGDGDEGDDWGFDPYDAHAGREAAAGDLSELGEGPSGLDHFTHDDYAAATTREYQGLAEEVARAATEEVERQAVAAAIPGVGSGLIGFDDVTGVRGLTEEEAEAEEQRRASDLTLRVGTAVVLVGIFLGSLFLGRAAFAAFVLAVAVLSLGEFYATSRTRGFAPAAVFGFLGVAGAVVGTLRAGVAAIGVSLGATALVVGLFYALANRRHPLENASLTIVGAAWVSMLAFAVEITVAPAAEGLILLVVVLTAFFDIGSYFAGRAFGRRPMAPIVSPRKTWEGFLGGVVTVTLLAAVLSTFKALFPINLSQALILAGVVAVFAPLGDASESVVKRALEVKDMGSLLPGHGGMLDRIDAILFVVPAAYLLFGMFGLL